MEREEAEKKESVRKIEKERHEMKYKVGDKVKVRSDLEKHKGYGGWYTSEGMVKIRGEIVTIRGVKSSSYELEENDFRWTDEMFEGLAEELTAEEAIKVLVDMCARGCKNCELGKSVKESRYSFCSDYRREHPDKVVEVLKRFKKDHEKKPIETERAIMVRVLVGNDCNGKCVHEEEVPSGETWDQAQARVLKEYCENHEGKYISTICGICRVKE